MRADLTVDKGAGDLPPARQGVGALICLEAGPAATGSAHPRLMVVWSGSRPIGQLYLAGEAPRPLETSDLRASVVICTRDRPEALARCLASIAGQSRRPDEVIVVDNASLGGETRNVCRRADVRYVREDRPGLDVARNTGARAARGEIVAYTDDDVILHADWLKRLIEAFDQPDIAAVTGLVLPAELATDAQWHFERWWGFGRGFQRLDFGAEFFASDKWRGCPVWRIGAGASMAFRKSVFDKVGYFDERLGAGAAGCSDDSEFWHRVLAAGERCRYEPTAVAYHFHRRDMDGLRRQIRAYMRGHATALLVQFERSGNLGNLRRLFVTLPLYYASRALRRALVGWRDEDRFTREQVAGLISGVIYYLRAPRPLSGGEP